MVQKNIEQIKDIIQKVKFLDGEDFPPLEIVFNVDVDTYKVCFSEFVENNTRFKNDKFSVIFEELGVLITFKNTDYVENWLRRFRKLFV